MKSAVHVCDPLIIGLPSASVTSPENGVVSARNNGTWKVPCTSRTPFDVVTDVTAYAGAKSLGSVGDAPAVMWFVPSHWYARSRIVSAGPARLCALATVKSQAWYGTVEPSTAPRS